MKQFLTQLWSTIQNVISIFMRKEHKNWIDADKDGLTTRQEVLFRDSISSTIVKSEKGTISIQGKWKCKYTNKLITQASQLDIDHIVPINYARNNKVGLWSQARFTEFANDLSNLVAVEGSINREKGDRSIAEWLPPKNKQWYKRRFREVCQKWNIRCKDSKKN